MSRILLVDDSPQAQRLGERILTEEGYEVVTVSNADSALIRLEDVDPDVVLADTVMPGRTGFDICNYLKMSPRHRHVRVILTAGVVEPLDEEQVKRSEADATLKKPFEATGLLEAVKPLAQAAAEARAQTGSQVSASKRAASKNDFPAPFVAVVDSEQLRAAVTVALDAAMGSMIDEISARVLAALSAGKPENRAIAKTAAEEPRQATPLPVPPAEPVRRVTPVRRRSGSLLALDLNRPEPPESE